MPIIITDCNGNVTRKYVGRVVKIRAYVAERNHSDTLDYTDWRATKVTQALVYHGRVVSEEDNNTYFQGLGFFRTGDEIPASIRFEWIDCTNLFVWRGDSHRDPKLDELAFLDGHLIEDYETWQSIQDAEAAKLAAHQALVLAKQKEVEAEHERNRPIKGKAMIVFKGRKVPVGTRGVVAHISDSGRVLLKASHEWQNRQAQGVWVDARNLRAE